jgi:hypothetical protein
MATVHSTQNMGYRPSQTAMAIGNYFQLEDALTTANHRTGMPDSAGSVKLNGSKVAQASIGVIRVAVVNRFS